MAGVIATGNISRLLQEGVKNVFGQAYEEHTQQWDMLFDTEQSSKAFELDQQFEGFGLAPVKTEGNGVAYDSQQEGFTPKYPNLTYAKGFIVTREAMEDNQYNLFNRRARALAFSMRQTKENVGANIYNRGFNSAFLMTGGDGVELFSTAHINGPSDSSTFSNELATPAALSEASLEELLIQISEATDPRGLRIAIKGERLIVPPKLGFDAERIMNSVLQNDTGNNAVNAVRSTGMLPAGYMVNNYLTSDTAWFIKTNTPDGMKHFNRQSVRFEQDNDFGTSNARFKADERYAMGWTDPRGAYGSAGV
tara:strand:+ start:22006 stop:22929 length:924 start_codon:yes stop_codon:yes gene_type:complete